MKGKNAKEPEQMKLFHRDIFFCPKNISDISDLTYFTVLHQDDLRTFCR